MSSVGSGGAGAHLGPVPYPPYIPPPKIPHSSTIHIHNVTVIDRTENCRRFRANVYVRDGVIAILERAKETELNSTLIMANGGEWKQTER